jgi:geranylgeranyl diphosphate synthase type I
VLDAAATLPPSYARYRTIVTERLRSFLAPYLEHDSAHVYELAAYHLGWRDEAMRSIDDYSGKMLRPVLCLTACSGFADPALAAGFAASIELLHAFSLLHDDIEDADTQRHGRATVWKLTGVPLAINAGDGMFELAHRLLFDSLEGLPSETVQTALRLYSDTCLRMIEGQHLDIAFEQRERVSTEEYAQMSRGKTGAMLGLPLALGALRGGADADSVESLRQAGIALGLAFQAVDDVLAIWGDPALTGKAVGNDLARGKKSLPVALAQEFGWEAPLDRVALDGLRSELEGLGVPDAVRAFAADHAAEARRLIASAMPAGPARSDLETLVKFSLARRA